MSTTTSERVALDYATGQKNKISVLLVIQQGMVDRGKSQSRSKDLSALPLACPLVIHKGR